MSSYHLSRRPGKGCWAERLRRAGQGAARGEEQERQGALAETWRASRAELLSRARPRELAAGDLARPREPDQAPARRSLGLQPVAIDASSHRSRHAEAMAGGGARRCGGCLESGARLDRPASGLRAPWPTTLCASCTDRPTSAGNPPLESDGRFFNRLLGRGPSSPTLSTQGSSAPKAGRSIDDKILAVNCFDGAVFGMATPRLI